MANDFEIENGILKKYHGIESDVVIPDSVTKIGSNAFSENESLVSIVIPDRVTEIGDYAFNKCKNLASVSIPGGVKKIGDHAFRDCFELSSISIPDSVTKIGIAAFYQCSLTSVTIPSSVKTIEGGTFTLCTRLKTACISEGVEEIGPYAFSVCINLTSVSIPDSVTKISNNAFDECKSLLTITIPDSVTKIENDTFSNCKGLTAVTIPDSVTEIGSGAFFNCIALTAITLPDSVTGIGSSTFERCTSLTEINIPDSVTEIGKYAFSGCTSLPSITIPKSLTAIADELFKNCTSLTSIAIPDSVTTIGDRAFYHCQNLTVTCSLDSYIRHYCEKRGIPVKLHNTGITSGCSANNELSNGFEIENGILKKYHGTESDVVIPDGVAGIGSHAFSENESLISVTIPDSVTVIDDSAFYKCKNLSSVSIPNSVTKIWDYAFYRCKSLTSITIPGSVTEIGESAFRECNRLTSFTIPDGVTCIRDSLFDSCGRLASLTVPASVKKIEDHAFYLVPSVTFICPENSYTHRYCLENKRPFIFDYQFEAFHGLLPQGFKKLASPFLADEEKPFIFISYSHKDRDTVLPILRSLYEDGWKIWYDEGLTIGDRYDETLEEHVRNCSAFLLFVSENSVNSYYCIENEIPWANKYGKPVIRCDLDEEPEFELEGITAAAAVTRTEIGPALEQISGLTRGERREAKGITVIVDPTDRDGAEGDGFAYCLYTAENAATAKAILLEAKNSGCTLYDAVEDGPDEEKLQNAACLIVFLDKAFLADKALTKTLTEAYLAGRDIAVCQVESISNEDLPPELLSLHKMQWLHFAHGINADMNRKLARHLQKRGCRNTATLPGFEYEKTDNGIVIKRYTGLDPNPRIEREYGGIPVVEIADEAFKNCAHLKTIVIPDSVKSIGNNAFQECLELSSVIIPESVTKIGYYAFYWCNPTSVTIPGGVKTIDSATFGYCFHLETAIISEGVTEIGYFAFGQDVNLTSVTIPDSVTKIVPNAFVDCSKLTVTCSPDSYARKFCEEHNIPFRSSRPGFFARLFGKK